jgi:hypothetical protein
LKPTSGASKIAACFSSLTLSRTDASPVLEPRALEVVSLFVIVFHRTGEENASNQSNSSPGRLADIEVGALDQYGPSMLATMIRQLKAQFPNEEQ